MRILRSLLPLLVALQIQATTAAAANLPTIHFRHRTLANGLEVYSVEDHGSPTVAVDVWYRVGSKNDPEGRSGFAHLFEHMMFKSTRHMPAEQMDRFTEDVGGWNNASTWDDYTDYFEVIPSNYLETLLWAEAERLGSLNVDDANFKSERDVVKEEFRFRVLAPPYGRLFTAIDRSSFAVHPYRRPGIGNIAELDAATIDDVRAFHATYYRPDNAYLIVVGDLDPQQFDAWVDRYFGPLTNPSTSIPRVTVKEPPRSEEKRVDEYAPNVPLPAAALTWLAPAESSADSAAMHVLATILGDGESSRLYESLVHRGALAAEIEADADLREDLGLFTVLVILASGHTPAEGEKAARAELQALAEKGPSAAEVEKAKNLILTADMRRRETNNGKADALGRALLLNHDPEAVNSSLMRLQAVTPADVQRVLRTYVTGAKAVVIHYRDESQKPGGSK